MIARGNGEAAVGWGTTMPDGTSQSRFPSSFDLSFGLPERSAGIMDIRWVSDRAVVATHLYFFRSSWLAGVSIASVILSGMGLLTVFHKQVGLPFWILILGWPALLLGTGGIMWAVMDAKKQAMARGPLLIFDPLTDKIEYPRSGHAFSRSAVVRLILVRGWMLVKYESLGRIAREGYRVPVCQFVVEHRAELGEILSTCVAQEQAMFRFKRFRNRLARVLEIPVVMVRVPTAKITLP